MVQGLWDRPLADLLIESGAHCAFGNDVHDACTGFVGWCFKQLPVPGDFSFFSLPGVPWNYSDFDRWEWYARLMNEVAGWKPTPILVDTDYFLIEHRGEILWPPLERRRNRPIDRRTRLPGALFPVGWFGPDLGQVRCNNGNCYPPEDLPPIRQQLNGTFDWLQAAPEHCHSIAPDPALIATALDGLLAAKRVHLPVEFLNFFRAPTLWRKIRSCKDRCLDLDSIAVGIRGGRGSLVRFLSESQGCKTWSLFASSGDSSHAVVATYFFMGSASPNSETELPHPKDITICAGSFEEFIYRFWMENELWFALHDMGEMPAGGEEYLDFYRSRSQTI